MLLILMRLNLRVRFTFKEGLFCWLFFLMCVLGTDGVVYDVSVRGYSFLLTNSFQLANQPSYRIWVCCFF